LLKRLFAALKNRGGAEANSLDVIVQPLPENVRPVEEYWVHRPYARIVIVEKLGEIKYYALEEPLDALERQLYSRIISFLERELDPPGDDVNRAEYVVSEAERLMSRYKRLNPASEASKHKILYYLVRDLAGFGPIHPLMLDPNIEDISCNGVGVPIYVYHRKYESIPTNIVFASEEALDNFIVKLAHMSGKHVSSASPIVDATLPGRHRLAATFMREVSYLGSTFCIRKFREKPFSIIELASMGTLDWRIAAYLWMLVENKMSIMVLGGTGAGKTTMLNALVSLIPPELKIVTVEETAEINVPHENWVPLVAREEFGFVGARARTVSLFDLVKVSLRYRPDYLIVGEIRGEEAYVLFQALATGHGGMSTMHADSLDYAVKRLTSPPMNISKVYLPLMNAWMHIERVNVRGKTVRRVRAVWELDESCNYRVIAEWLPVEDRFSVNLDDSVLLAHISKRRGISLEEVVAEVEHRASYLRSLGENGVTAYRRVAAAIRNYGKNIVDAARGDRR